ncbi:Lrp/AsnC family transcriptional regulator [Granulicella mallensis]|uniref:Transcriptional regulator, AsnC family n=2 Tax=Granulicella mallensis TaxID=940614 RepID=G8P0F0_GRAMM|nr:Lrp/AsnC family transcriptional regulator [Granulicella mallensis]AEU38038.1 transcriptional regulator, AsnC family [Granulicella mallensis MP5ACTX8]MBB5066739.1 Lrp/AsnC family leucine-responsive transcriptional regulator [Granulicella mallensis]
MLSILDEIDVRILDILQEEGRISVLDLAEKVGLSPTPCGRRLRALEDKGYIEKYVALLQPRMLGIVFDVFLKVRLKSSDKAAIHDFLDAVRGIREIQRAYFITGDYDYLIHVRTESAETFKNFLLERILTLGVAHTQSYIVLEEVKNTTALPISSPGHA